MNKDLAATSSRPWLQRIEDAEKAFAIYQEKCDNIDRHFAELKEMAKLGDREFKIFWANLEVLKPTIYSRAPQPVVAPRHGDSGMVPRKASELLERALEYDLEADDLHDTLKMVRDDLALSARGQAWVLDNSACIHVDRKDFIHDPARYWNEVDWVARRAYLTRKQMKERFPEAKLQKVKFEEVKDQDKDEYKTSSRKAQVWEIWSRSEGKVIWVTPDYPDILDESEPMINVKAFFPCPRPAYGTCERRKLTPVPDFVFYRDQVDEINELTDRISSLSESLRLKGFYAAGTSEVGEAIEAAMKATDNKAILVPVSSMSALGGQSLKDSIIWLPVEEIANTITNLVALRQQLIQDVYEITGLSDIMRGSTEAQETATAQNLKAQYGSIRVRERQAEMVRFARDIIRIKAEVFAENYDIQQLAAMANMQLPNQMQAEIARQKGQKVEASLEEIDQLIKSERMRPFVLEVETDSTIAPNEEAEKQARIEFITAVGGFIQQASGMVATAPETAPFAAKMLKFTAQGFRAGRELSTAIDDFAAMIEERAQQAMQGGDQPSPEQIEAQTKAEETKARIQQDDRRVAVEEGRLQLEAQKIQTEMGRTPEAPDNTMDMARLEAEREKEANKNQLEREKMAQQATLEREKMERDNYHRDADRKSKDNDALTAAGMPPDYSFKDDREQFKALMDQMTAMQEMMTQTVTTIGEGQQRLADAMQDQAKVDKAPKRVVRDNSGRVVGVETIQ